ncbi:MAG: hypothetical protein ACRD0G_01700 [Acidimicrobiales bacterium]
MRETITIAGSLAQRPRVGGHTWVFLQYLLGFRRLGWDVHFVDRLEPGTEKGAGVDYLASVMERVGLGDRWTLLYDGGREVYGVDRAEAVSRARRSAFLLNVMGFLDDADLLAAAPRRVFLDIDPGFGQLWRDLGLHDLFAGHDDHVTIGENIGRPGCLIPTCGLDWITTKQPVVLDEWPVAGEAGEAAEAAEAAGGRITSVCSWRGPFGPIEHHGTTYGLRVHEFRRFLELPSLTGETFELALDIDDADAADLDRLRANGWGVVDPSVVASDPWRYRGYVQQSAAELCVAKQLYVATGSGWFSDRSACYLASGRPVVAQDTGLAGLVPAGDGLLTFGTLDEAVAAVEAVRSDPVRHGRAAREVAEAHFSSDVVLPKLLAALGVS